MHRFFTLLSALFLLVSSLSAYTTLRVQHPQQTWRYGQGTIEKAIFSVRPKGVYAQHDLYLTFSARGLTFTSQDSVEVQLDFNLPTDAFVTDLWLWIDDSTIVRGLLMDRWTASTIYEGIVKRRRDPAFLVKTGAGQYQLRIYPLIGTGTRKIKLTYLTRNEWTTTSFSTSLPTELLRASKYLPNPYMMYWPQGGFGEHLRITEYPDITPIPRTDSLGTPFWEFRIPGTYLSSTVTLAGDAPFNNGLYLQRYVQGSEGLYQLVLLPTRSVHLSSPRKVLVLFDFDPTKSTSSASVVLSTVRSALSASLSAADSFNLMFSGITIRRAGQQWFSGDSSGVAAAFAAAGSNPISNYSSLPALLADGVHFVKEHGGDGVLWLVANTDQVTDYTVANSLLRDVLGLMESPIPVYISDFNDTNTRYSYINGQYYYGNQYFYENLARQTEGTNSRITSATPLSPFLNSTVFNLWGFANSFDLHTSLASGFCYARYSLSQDLSLPVSVRRPIVQVGKLSGQFPFVIEMAGEYEGSVFSETITVPEAEIQEGDSTVKQIWASRFLSSLEGVYPQSTDIVRQILGASLDARVLSLYTSFLALEPNDTIKACTSCPDESKLVGVKEDSSRAAKADTLLRAYPNPFNAYVTLQFVLPRGISSEDAQLEIYNVLGQRVKKITLSAPSGGSGQVVWNATNDEGSSVGSGIYFAILSAPGHRAMMKLMLVK